MRTPRRRWCRPRSTAPTTCSTKSPARCSRTSSATTLRTLSSPPITYPPRTQRSSTARSSADLGLGESSQMVCPRCEGHGRMRSIESLSLSIVRVAEEHAMKENTGQVLVQAPVDIANYLLNEKRSALREIEQRHDAPIVIVADEQLHTPHYEVTRLRENELGEESSKPSYRRGSPRKAAAIALTKANLNVPPPAAVTNVQPAQPAPMREAPPEHRTTRLNSSRRQRVSKYE